MPNQKNHAIQLLKWIERNPGWWYLICTPNEPLMTLTMMQTLIRQLHVAGLDDLIFVMLMVHREADMVKTFPSFALLDCLIDRWGNDSEKIIRRFITHFE